MAEGAGTIESDLNPPKQTSRIGRWAKFNSETKLHKPIVEGLENLTNIPKNEKVIITPNHLSDIDIETVIATVAPYRDVSVADQSTHLEVPIFGSIMQFLGENELYGVSSKFGKKKTWLPTFRLNPQDYEAMKVPLEKGRALVIAAHQPTHEWKLPAKPGIGGILLAQKTGATILPTAVDIKCPEFIDLSPINFGVLKRLFLGKRLDVKVTFGKPIRLEPIPSEEIKILEKFLNHDERHGMTKDEIQIARTTFKKLQSQGSEVMQSLANMLPQEKRGIWKDNKSA